MSAEFAYTEDDLTRFEAVALKLVHEVGQMISEAIAKQKSVDLKDADCKEGNASSVLTETDTAVERHLVKGLSEAFPDHCFIGKKNNK